MLNRESKTYVDSHVSPRGLENDECVYVESPLVENFGQRAAFFGH